MENQEIRVESHIGKSTCGHFKAKIVVLVGTTVARELFCQTCFDTQEEAIEVTRASAEDLKKTIVKELTEAYPDLEILENEPAKVVSDDYKSRMH